MRVSRLPRLLLLPLLVLPLTLAAVDGPLTTHFQNWLSSNGYAGDDFAKADYGSKGSYGGRQNDDDPITHIPVIFFHGNSDSALHSSLTATGWDNSIAQFLKQGYTTAELYATSWGDTNELNAALRTHDCKTVNRLRRFVEAVLKYTGADKVSIISHSMGVTLARKVIKGGSLQESSTSCNVGDPINRRIDTFLGLAGGNYGLCNCEGEDAIISPTCNAKNGLWPGDSCGFNILDCGNPALPFACSTPTYSTFLTNLNNDNTKEASYVYSAWSELDDVLMYATIVWGRSTSLIPTSDAHHVYLTYSHMETKELTAEDQYSFVALHQPPN